MRPSRDHAEDEIGVVGRPQDFKCLIGQWDNMRMPVFAALARMASLAGLSPLLVEIEGRSGLPALFGQSGFLGYDEIVLAPVGAPSGAGAVRGRTLTPDDALLEYLDEARGPPGDQK